MIGSNARRRAVAISAARWSSAMPRWRLMSAWIAGRHRSRSRIVRAASSWMRSSVLFSNWPNFSTARGDSSRSRVLTTSGTPGRPPGLALRPGNQCPWLVRSAMMPQLAAPFIWTPKPLHGRLFNGCLVASERLLTIPLSLATSARRDDVKNRHYRFENKHRTEPTPPFAPGVEHQHKPCRIPHLKVHSGASLHRLRSF